MGSITTADGTTIVYTDRGSGQPAALSHGRPLTSDGEAPAAASPSGAPAHPTMGRIMSGIHSASRRGALYCALAIALVFLAGCGSTSSSGGAASGGSPAGAGSGTQAFTGATITIKDFTFTTPPSVSPGATVAVDNEDGLAHTVTADGGTPAFDSPAPAGNSHFTAPSAPGSYPFHCSIHPEMQGVLVVK